LQISSSTQICTWVSCSVVNLCQLYLDADSGQSKHRLKIQASWDMAPCILGYCNWCFMRRWCLIFIAVTLPGLVQKLQQQMAPNSQLHIHPPTWHHIPQHLNLYQHYCKEPQIFQVMIFHVTLQKNRTDFIRGGIPVTHALWPYLIICLCIQQSSTSNKSVEPSSQRRNQSHLTLANVANTLR
jgi:hypothetical protein